MSVCIDEHGTPWINGKPYEWSDSDVDNFQGYEKRRFRLMFESGWTLSVVFGWATYSDNYNVGRNEVPFREEVNCVEVAVWDKDNQWAKWGNGDNVMGYVSADDLVALIDDIQTWPSDHALGEQRAKRWGA